MATSEISPTRERLLRLREQFGSFRDSRVHLRHAMIIRIDDGFSRVSDQDFDVRLGAEMARLSTCERLRPISPPRETYWKAPGQVLVHGFFGSESAGPELSRFSDLAGEALSVATQFLKEQESPYRLIELADFLIPPRAGVRDLYWVLACYNLAWDFHASLNYHVEGRSSEDKQSTEDDPGGWTPGPPRPPFPDRVTFEQWGRGGYDLRLMPPVPDLDGIPNEGKSLVIVADVAGLLNFRVFDCRGVKAVDTDETRLKGQAARIEDLKKQLNGLWPPHTLTRSEVDPVISAVTLILAQTCEREEVPGPVLLNGWYSLWLTQDVRFCSMEAVDLILGWFVEGERGKGSPHIWERMLLSTEGPEKYFVAVDRNKFLITYNAYLFIQALIAEKGRDIPFKSIPGLEGVKLDRVKAKLPSEILEHIETKTGKGCRLVDKPGVS